MTPKEILVKEINELPGFMVSRLLDIVHYLKLGVELEFTAQTDNQFYKSREFQDIVTESISEYRHGKAEDMDLSEE